MSIEEREKVEKVKKFTAPQNEDEVEEVEEGPDENENESEEEA